ncbi:MAG: prepilin-type N-terminal cleavage/methylation domain-containing protein [Alphaproteobacteria bacterium]
MIKTNRAFTLIELAIVIIIVGIIMGGIAAGSALIKQGQIRAVIKDIQKIQTAIYAFREKFGFLPGDFSNAGAIWSTVASCPDSAAAAGCNGNGNGFFDSSETYKIWQHLSLANMIEGSYTGLGSSRYIGGVNVMSMPTNNGVYALRGTSSSLYSYPSRLNTINLLKDNNVGNEGALNAEDSYAIDVKIDDGAPSTGKFVAGRGSSVNGTTTCVNAVITSTASSISYLMDDPLRNCRAWYLIN